MKSNISESDSYPHSNRRLLDMLTGWLDYTYKCSESEEPHPGVTAEEYLQEVDELGKLRVLASAQEDLTDDQVDTFLREKVLPLVLKGPRP